MMDLIKPLLTQTLVSKAANWLGESESSVAKALGAALPTLLGLVLNKAGDKSLQGGLTALLGSKELNSEQLLAEPQTLFASSLHASPLGNLGNQFLDQLLGAQRQGVQQALSQHAGIGVGSASKLLSSAAPLALALLGKSGSQGMSALAAQKDALMAAVPGPVAALLGFESHASAAANFAANQANGKQSGGFPLWILPIAAALAFAGYLFLKPKAEVQAVSTNGVTATPMPAGVHTIEMKEAPKQGSDGMQSPDVSFSAPLPDADGFYKDLGEVTEKLLPGDVKLSIPAKGIEAKLVAFVEDPNQAIDKQAWFDFDRILFDSSKATLRPESNEQIHNIAMILKAFPNVQLKIGGYTDNQGKPEDNLKLSSDRAAAVLAAIAAQGVDVERMQSEGYGEQHPISSNDSAAGRQLNRRVSARVTAK